MIGHHNPHFFSEESKPQVEQNLYHHDTLPCGEIYHLTTEIPKPILIEGYPTEIKTLGDLIRKTRMDNSIEIKELGKILGGQLRQNDILARYGGEEFVIILPESSKGEAYSVAEKLRKTIEKREFKGEKTQPLGRVTASMGVSTYPEDGSTGPEIIKHADDLLYEAKRKGRNMVRV